MSNGILLLSGKFYDYDDPSINDWDIEDVALGLSHLCRFAGQCPAHYSVAQHSVYVSYAIEPEFALEGLLHDITETFMVDIPTPLKRILPDYKRLEKLHEAYAMARFGLDYPLRKEVHIADKRVFAAEVRDFRPEQWEHYAEYLDGVEPFEGNIVPWEPEDAEEIFLYRFDELMSERVYH